MCAPDVGTSSDDEAERVAYELKAVEVYIETLKLLQATAAALTAGLAGFLGFSGIAPNAMAVAAFISLVVAIGASFMGMVYAIWPLWDEEFDLESVLPRLWLGLGCLAFVAGLVLAVLVVV